MFWAVIFFLSSLALGVATFEGVGNHEAVLRILFVASVICFLIAFTRVVMQFASERIQRSIDRSGSGGREHHQQR